MADFYELDFLPCRGARSGDAIAIRFQIGQHWYVHVVDGGYASTGEDLERHIRQYFRTNLINNVVVTHPHQDHAEGLATILENFTVQRLWMFRPWSYSQHLLPHFARYTSAENLTKRFREEYPYLARLEAIAVRKGIEISEPVQGTYIGPFAVLSPSLARYIRLVIESEKTPQQSELSVGIFETFAAAVKPSVTFIKAGWGSERFSPEATDSENEMSVVQYALIDGERILLTGDAGRRAMTEAADHAPMVGLLLPGITRFQAPHHGGRRNLSTDILDRWLGPRLAAKVPAGSERFTAMISSAKEDTDHPRKAVLRALLHRGALVVTTESGPFTVFSRNAPTRGWPPMTNVQYPDEQEA